MGEKDKLEKVLADYNDVFADIVNVLLFDGKKVVREDSLENSKDRSIYKIDGKLHEQERDVSKYLTDKKIRIALIGLENQTAPEKYLPLRIIGYDGAAYRAQLLKGTSKEKYPVITLVLYLGLERWNHQKSLHGVLNIPDIWKPYVSDYRVNIFEIADLKPEKVKLFKSDFRFVADYLVQMRVKGDYKPSNDMIRHVDEVFKLMAVMTQEPRFEECYNAYISRSKDRKEGVSMSSYWGKVFDEVEARGEARGCKRGAILALNNRGVPVEEIAGLVSESEEYVQRILEENPDFRFDTLNTD